MATLVQPFDVWIPDDPRAVTHIPWCHRTNNVSVGCLAKDPSCGPCWASGLVATRMSANPNLPRYKGLAVLRESTGKAKWTGRVELFPERFADPIGWKTPSRIFWDDLSDFAFEAIPFEYMAACFGIAVLAPQHQHQFLTRRPERALAFFEWLRKEVGSRARSAEKVLFCVEHVKHIASEYQRKPELGRLWSHAYRGDMVLRKKAVLHQNVAWPLPNVHLGFSASTQALFDERWPILRACDAAIRWVSYEAAYEPCNFGTALSEGLDWVVMGGESDAKSPMDFKSVWADCALTACQTFKKPFFMKQMGTVWARRHGAKQRKGEDMKEWPERLRVRQFPVALPLLKTAKEKA